MIGSVFSTITDTFDGINIKLKLYLVLFIIAIVLVSLLLDKVRKFIRGLDTAALGALFIWVSSKIPDVPAVKVLAEFLMTAGITLAAFGVVIFIVSKIFRPLRARRKYQASTPVVSKVVTKDEDNKEESSEEQSEPKE